MNECEHHYLLEQYGAKCEYCGEYLDSDDIVSRLDFYAQLKKEQSDTIGRMKFYEELKKENEILNHDKETLMSWVMGNDNLRLCIIDMAVKHFMHVNGTNSDILASMREQLNIATDLGQKRFEENASLREQVKEWRECAEKLDDALTDANSKSLPVSWEDASESSYEHILYAQLKEKYPKEGEK